MKFIFKYFSQLLSSIVGNYYGHVITQGCDYNQSSKLSFPKQTKCQNVAAFYAKNKCTLYSGSPLVRLLHIIK